MEKFYIVERGKVVTYTVEKQSPKLIYARGDGWRDWRQQFHMDKFKVAFFETPLDAWCAEVGRLRAVVERDKKALQDSRTQLGMAESELRKAEESVLAPTIQGDAR